MIYNVEIVFDLQLLPELRVINPLILDIPVECVGPFITGLLTWDHRAFIEKITITDQP